MSAAEHLQEAIDVGCTRDDHDHVADHRAEVLAEAKVETVAWLVKKGAEQKTWDAAVLASKVDRGAVRAFIGTAHYRDALDAHRAEVLAEAAAPDYQSAIAEALRLLESAPEAFLGASHNIRAAAHVLRQAGPGPVSYTATRGEPGPDVQVSADKLRNLLGGGK